MKYKLVYKQYSENAILIEWPSIIDDDILQNLISFKKTIENNSLKQIVEVVSAYNSLLIIYKSTIENVYNEFLRLKTLYRSDKQIMGKQNRLWKIPVCYSPALAPDLEFFCKVKSLTIEKLVTLHTTPVYTVYFLGFLPGFLYLGGMDSKLDLARKNTPSSYVKKGSVAIGGNQTGIYPIDSPGGWHVIGSCPLEFFTPQVDPPCFISSGDKIKYISITEKEYNDISLKIINDNYNLESTIL